MTDTTVETINSSEFAALINATAPTGTDVLGELVDTLGIKVTDGNDAGPVIDVPVVEVVQIPVTEVPEVQQDEQDHVMNSGEVVNFLLNQANPANPANPDLVPNIIYGPILDKVNDIVRIEIIEQPARNRLRFRFASEGRGAGALQGTNSTESHRTFPTIRIHGTQYPAIVIVSCVQHEPDENGLYRPHPHKLVGRNSTECLGGVCKKIVTPAEEMTCDLKNVGVQCMRRMDIKEALEQRESIKVDPFGTGFSHKNQNKNFELNKIRLAFQVFLKPQGDQGPTIMVKDVAVSEIIADRKACGDLEIVACSDTSSPFVGGKKIMLFTEKVNRDDIEVHFSYCDPTDGSSKTLKGNFSPNDVHHQFGIALTTPAVPHFNVTNKIEAQMRLSSKANPDFQSNEIPFVFYNNIIEEKKPVIVATRTAKRDRNTIKAEAQAQNVPQEESTGRIILPPKGFKSGGGSVVTVKIEDEEPEEPKMSDMILKADLNAIAAANTTMDPPSMNSMQEFQKLLQSQQAKSQPSTDGISVDAMAMQFNPDVFDDLSQLSQMSLDDMKLANVQNSGLETPDVSMEKSKSKTNNQNNLDL